MTTPTPAPMTSENGSCYPLQEVLRTAFPDLRFTTMQVMNMHLDLEQRFGQFIGHKSERDALTAARAAFDLSESERQRLAGRINALEAELAAARKVEDGDVQDAVDWLRDRAECSSITLDPAPMGPIADLLTRLSAALKEAEARETDAKTLQHQLASDLTVAVARALQTKDTTP